MLPELLASVAGIVLSLLFSYVPGLSGKWANLSADIKRLVMLVLLAVVTGVVYGLTCAGIEIGGVAVVCDQSGAWALVKVFIAAMIANQSAFALSPQKK